MRVTRPVFTATLVLALATAFFLTSMRRQESDPPMLRLPGASDESPVPKRSETTRAADKNQHSPEIPTILHVVDEQTKNRVEPWFDEFRSQSSHGDPITEYEFVTFDDNVFQKIRNHEVHAFRLKLSKEFDFVIDANDSYDYGSGWILNGSIRNRDDGSKATIFVKVDGTYKGDIYIQGIGRLMIEPTGLLPQHVVYLKTGAYFID